MSKSRSKDWLAQAKNDLMWGKASLKEKYYSQTCFISQQAAEKALKALCYFYGYDFVKSHSLLKIIRSLKINGDLEEASKILDQYYITARYPDSLPQGAPFEFFTEKQAKESLQMAELFIEKAENEIK
jgi:HEPN domain-containing protein